MTEDHSISFEKKKNRFHSYQSIAKMCVTAFNFIDLTPKMCVSLPLFMVSIVQDHQIYIFVNKKYAKLIHRNGFICRFHKSTYLLANDDVA